MKFYVFDDKKNTLEIFSHFFSVFGEKSVNILQTNRNSVISATDKKVNSFYYEFSRKYFKN